MSDRDNQRAVKNFERRIIVRTVLDKATIVFEQGFKAFKSGWLRSANPYADGDDRKNWFEGWDYGKECNGECNG